MKSYTQFRQEFLRHKIIENLLAQQPQASQMRQQGQQPQTTQMGQQPQMRQQPQIGQKPGAVRPNSPSFFQGMNFAPGLRRNMVNQASKSPIEVPGQPPMPQV